MRIVAATVVLNAPQKIIRDLFYDIDNYPKYVGYCLSAKAEKPIREGGKWADWSLVVGVPILVKHEILKISDDEFIYRIPLIGGGEMFQKFKLTALGGQTQVDINLSFDFKNKLLSFLLNNWIESRNRRMVEITIANVKKLYGQSKAN